MINSLYINAVQKSRQILARVGALAWLDRHVDRRPMHWLRSQFAVYSIEDLVALDTPWWTYKAIDEVESWLEQRPKTVVFEWGSGASTVWLQKRATSVTSVEHDETFSSIVQPYLGDNSTLLVRPGVSSEHPRIGSAKRGFTQLDFTAYVEAIDEVEGKFDLIVIDGRARSVCLERATSRLNDGGIIVFDNSHRRRYQDALGGTHLRLSRTRGLTPASPYPTETSLLRR